VDARDCSAVCYPALPAWLKALGTQDSGEHAHGGTNLGIRDIPDVQDPGCGIWFRTTLFLLTDRSGRDLAHGSGERGRSGWERVRPLVY
jgi:hypothetical protein